jgi:hypothetical protein
MKRQLHRKVLLSVEFGEVGWINPALGLQGWAYRRVVPRVTTVFHIVGLRKSFVIMWRTTARGGLPLFFPGSSSDRAEPRFPRICLR